MMLFSEGALAVGYFLLLSDSLLHEKKDPWVVKSLLIQSEY